MDVSGLKSIELLQQSFHKNYESSSDGGAEYRNKVK